MQVILLGVVHLLMQEEIGIVVKDIYLLHHNIINQLKVVLR